MMPDDFCAFILTHGRPDRVHTYKTLINAGYTGKIYIVIDDEDKTADEYRTIYGNKVLQFSKEAIAKTFDEGDNFNDRRVIIYARNACWDLARKVGCKYFIQLDDDYSGFYIRFNSQLKYGNTRNIKKNIDEIFIALLNFYLKIPALSIALSQGGDHIGGGGKDATPKLMRKCMNSFICSTEKQFNFFGRINEDVNTYTTLSRRGEIFFTVFQAQLNQLATQSNKGGMTDIYLDGGTYIKSFYSVMYCPSAVKIGELSDPRSPNSRLHHAINWHNVAPKILHERHRRRMA